MSSHDEFLPPDDNDEFERIIEANIMPSSAVNVVEIAEQATMVEFRVPLDVSDHPEATLFEVISEYLASRGRRRALVGCNVVYHDSGDRVDLVAGVLLSSQEVAGDE